jgi:hypothetical protein
MSLKERIKISKAKMERTARKMHESTIVVDDCNTTMSTVVRKSVRTQLIPTPLPAYSRYPLITFPTTTE